MVQVYIGWNNMDLYLIWAKMSELSHFRCFPTALERKAKSIIVNPEEDIGGGGGNKKWSWSPQHNKWKHANAFVQDLLTTLILEKKTNPSRKVCDKNSWTKGGNGAKDKPMVAKPKVETSYLSDVIWYGRL